MTRNELLRRYPHSSEAFLRANPDSAGLCPGDPKPAQGVALDRQLPRKEKGGFRHEGRARIRFVIYSVRPGDWDAFDLKAVQDCLVHSGILDADDWDRLECEGIRSEKVHTKAEEKTVIDIFYP